MADATQNSANPADPKAPVPGIANGNKTDDKADTTPEELTKRGKRTAGFLIIFSIVAAITAIIAIWSHIGNKIEAGAHTSEVLVLVALGGFLGNMIHITNSFVAYVGSGQYRKKWLLFYITTPFTASALAMIVYFAFQKSFTDLSSMMTMATLAGLFTDKTTQKLKELMDVLFSATKDKRTDGLNEKPADPKPQTGTDFTITAVSPETLSAGQPNKITLTGLGLMGKKITIQINGDTIANPMITDTAISFDYNPNGVAPYQLTLTDDKGNSLYTATLTV